MLCNNMILDVIDELGSQRNNNNILAINHFKKSVPSLQPLLAYDPSFTRKYNN